jgi:Asp-tRNA(Asn)/Glu-tRNA(Gln) amidotransferase A subunit family amidase
VTGRSASLAELALGKGSAEALLDGCLDRIAAEDGRWHAMLAINDDARNQARAADAVAAAGGSLGVLHGIPVVVKDNIDVAGMATTSGCRALAGAMPLRDAQVVGRLKAAGAIIVGKTNLSEFSFEIRSRSSLGGDVLCPVAPWATAGGSSGGSAVAVARGFALAALGSDTGGSIRIPAACNGLVGFRPAHGVLSLAGFAPLAPSTDTVGVLARSVANARLLYGVMGGALAGSTVSVDGLRLGVLRSAFGEDPSVIAASERGLDALRGAGVALVDPFIVAGLEELLDGPHIVDAEFAAAFDHYLATNFVPGTAPASLATLVASGEFLPEYRSSLRQRMDSPPAAAAILARHAELKQALGLAMQAQGLDGLVFPTMRVIPDSLDNPKGGWAPELAARTGWPAISVPAPVPPGARPVGVEILVPAGKEETLFALAGVIERAGQR